MANQCQEIRIWLTVVLLALALGCQAKNKNANGVTKGTTKSVTSNDSTTLSASVRLSITAPESSIAQFTPGPFEFPTDPEHRFVLSGLRLDNVNQYIAEINRLKLKRIALDFRGRHNQDQPYSVLVERLSKGCPAIEFLSISQGNITWQNLHSLLELKQLRELALTVCPIKLTTEEAQLASESRLTLPTSAITKLSLHHCHGITNETLASLMIACPDLEQLMLYDTRSRLRGGGVAISGNDLPFHKLQKLETFWMPMGSSDELIRQLLANAPQLKSLRVPNCNELTGEDWDFSKLNHFEELVINGCQNISEESLNAILDTTPNLRTLDVSHCEQLRGDRLSLSSLADLRTLKFARQKLRPEFILEAVASLKHLESLSMATIPSLADCQLDFGQLTNLKSLWLDSCQLPPNVLASLPPSIESVSVNHCKVNNQTVATLLNGVPQLHTLKLTWISAGFGNEDDPQVINGDGWDFRALTKLRHLDLSQCFYLQDDVIARIAEQLPELESLRLAKHYYLTGEGWDLDRLRNLRKLELIEIDKLTDAIVAKLPKSLESLHISRCPTLTGAAWDLSAFSKLEDLRVSECKALVSMGSKLPPNLLSLSIYECREFQGNDLEYANSGKLRRMGFHECHAFDVDQLFAQLPKYATSLRTLDLTACPNLSTKNWDMSPIVNLENIYYAEGDSSLVGGIDRANRAILATQLPRCDVSTNLLD